MDHEIIIYIEEYRAKSDYKTFWESFSISRNANLFITMFFFVGYEQKYGGGFICKAFFILGQGHEYPILDTRISFVCPSFICHAQGTPPGF